MGDIRDLIDEFVLDRLINDDIWLEEQFENIDDGIWTTSDGEEIKISEMRTNHITNCVRFIEKGFRDDLYHGSMNTVATAYLNLFREELNRRFPPQDPAFIDG